MARRTEGLFGTRGDPSTCWCQYFKRDNAEWKNASRATCEPMLKQQVRDLDTAPGVIAYLDGEAVGWCAVEPRPSYRRLDRMRILKGSPERPDDDSVWAVTCFVVRVGFRKRGVGRALLAGAVDHARRGGARVVEGYPVDPAQREKVSSAELPGGTTVVKSRSPPRPNVVAFEVPLAGVESSLLAAVG